MDSQPTSKELVARLRERFDTKRHLFNGAHVEQLFNIIREQQRAAEERERLWQDKLTAATTTHEPLPVRGLRSIGFLPYGTHVDMVVSFDSMERAQSARANFTAWATQPPCVHPFNRLGIDGDGVMWCVQCLTKPLVIPPPFGESGPPPCAVCALLAKRNGSGTSNSEGGYYLSLLFPTERARDAALQAITPSYSTATKGGE